MKIRPLLILILLAPLFAIAEPNKSQLIGHWRHADEKVSVDHTFRADGTFSGRIVDRGKVAWQYGGKWSLVGNTLNYEYTKSSLERIPVGTRDSDKLVEITKDYYVIEARSGSRRKYVRVQSKSQRVRA